MKKLLSILALCSAIFCSNVTAHSAHGDISGQAAINIVSKSLPQMTFKEFGFEVGKLDASWKLLTSSDMSVVSVKDSFYVVSANNTETGGSIYFQIANNGQVMAVNHKNNF
jgi:hypothetical protein